MSEFEEGFQAYLLNQPFLTYKSREWKAGYLNAAYTWVHEYQRTINGEPDSFPEARRAAINDTLPHW